METETKDKILLEGIRHFRMFKVAEHGEYDLEDMTIQEAKEIASFISKSQVIYVKWPEVFNQIDKMLKPDPLEKLTANLLSAHTRLLLRCTEDRTKDASFDMTGDVEKKRQDIRDYIKEHNIKILNSQSFNWSI